MASETVTVIQGKKAIPPNLGIWAVCNLRSSTESNRRRRKETNEMRGRTIALNVQPTMTIKANSIK